MYKFLFEIKDIFKFWGISKSVDRLYSKCCLDSLEQSLYFINVNQEYGMYNDDIHYVPGKFNRYLSWRKRICGQINLEYVVLSKAKLYWRFLKAINIEIFLKIRLIFKDFKYLVSHWSYFVLCNLFLPSQNNMQVPCQITHYFINGKKEMSFYSRDL